VTLPEKRKIKKTVLALTGGHGHDTDNSAIAKLIRKPLEYC